MGREVRIGAGCANSLAATLMAALTVGCGGGGGDNSIPVQPSTGTLSAKVSGLKTGNTLELELRGAATVSVAANSSLTLAAGLALNSPFLVTIKSQPAGQICSVANGMGKATASTATVEITCSDGAPVILAELGATVSGAPAATQHLVAGQVSYGYLQIAPAPGVDASKLSIAVQQGVIAKLVPVASGKYLYEVDTAGMAAGSYPYSLKVVDATTGAYTLVKGDMVVLAPTAQGLFSVSAAGGSYALSDGTKIEVATSGLATPVGMTVAVAPSPTGPLLAFTFDREVSAAKIKVRILRDSAAIDPYQGIPAAQASVLTRAKAYAAALFDRAKAAVGLGTSGTATLNPAPYAAASTLPTADTVPLIKQGLGNLVIQGDYVPFKQSTGALSVQLTNQLTGALSDEWAREWALLTGQQRTAILETMREQPASVRPRLWDDVLIDTDFAPPNSWTSYFEAAKTAVQISYEPAYEVHTSITGRPADLNWELYEPVLFVHGFALTVGGGAGTWGNFPKLAMQTVLASQRKAAPFEFHWKTNQSFRQSADDLATVIQRIHDWSGGRPVHIVAHSFGGVLVRTVLQKISRSGKDVNAAVASLTTLGTPHSGIFPRNELLSGIAVPKGQDALSFALCWQITCFEMGESLDWSPTDKENLHLLGSYAAPGAHALKLASTATELPKIPIHVGIGMTVGVSLDGLRAQTGDYLISFAGQRFELGSTRDSVAHDLLNQSVIGKAPVTETILGMPHTQRPGEPLNAEMPSARGLGYLHSGQTGFANTGLTSWMIGTQARLLEKLDVFDLVDLQNYMDTEWVRGQGLMAAPSFECATPATCVHAGYLLFKQALADPLNRSNVQLAAAQALPPVRLKPGSAAWAPKAEEVPPLRELLREVGTAGIVNGSGIDWRLLPASERERYLQRLHFVPAPTGWIGDYSAQYEALSQFREKYSRNANLKATVQATFWSADAAAKYVQLAGNMATALRGELALVYPAAGVAAELGSRLTNAAVNEERALHVLRQLKTSVPFLNVFKDCAVALPVDFTSVIDKLEAGDKTVATWAEAVAIPVKCLSSGFDFANKAQWANYASLFTSALKTTEGTEVALLTATVDAFNTVLSMLPPDPYLMRVRGGLDIVSAVLDSIAIGNDMAANAQAAYVLVAERIDAQLTILVNLVNEQRTLQMLSAKSATAYSLDDQLATLQLSTSTPIAGTAFMIWLTDAWVGVKSAVISFSGQLGTLMASVLPDGTTAKLSKLFSSAGPASVFATLFDGASGTGAQVGRKQVDVTVAPPIPAPPPAVTAVVPVGTVTVGTLATFDVQGSNLVPGMAFALNECQPITELLAQGTASSLRFTCTFAAGTSVGMKNGAIALAKDAGNPFATPLMNFQVLLQAATVVPKITAAIEITPATPVVGDTITFIARGESLLNTGWMFKFSGMDYCGKPAALPTKITPTELRYSCTATAPTNLLGAVAVTSSDLVSQHGSAALVRVNCKAPLVLNTASGQCVAATDGTLTLLASDFVRGSNIATNVEPGVVCRNGLVYNAPPYALVPNWGEWALNVPAAGRYVLSVEYAAADSRPVDVRVNTALVYSGAVAGVTGGWCNSDARWAEVGEVSLAAGANTLRLESAGVFPHLRSIRLVRVSTSPPLAPSKVPHSGITASQCYGAGSDLLIDCGSAASLALYSEQDGMRRGHNAVSYDVVPNPAGGSFETSECVVDNGTGLMWEGKTTTGVRASSNRHTNIGDGRIADASAYVAAVNESALCGFADWRLPDVEELQGLVIYGIASPGATITSAWFPNASNTPHWTSQASMDSASLAWYVNFDYGSASWSGRGNSYAVRLVRGSRPL